MAPADREEDGSDGEMHSAGSHRELPDDDNGDDDENGRQTASHRSDDGSGQESSGRGGEDAPVSGKLPAPMTGYIIRRVLVRPAKRTAAAAPEASSRRGRGDDDQDEGWAEGEVEAEAEAEAEAEEEPPQAPMSDNLWDQAVSSMNEAIKAAGASLAPPSSLGAIQHPQSKAVFKPRRNKHHTGGDVYESQLGTVTLAGTTLFFQRGFRPGKRGSTGGGEGEVHTFELNGNTSVDLTKGGRELTIRVPTFSSDAVLAVAEELCLSAPPPHLACQYSLKEWHAAITRGCSALRSPTSRPRAFTRDRAKPNMYHAVVDHAMSESTEPEHKHKKTLEFGARFAAKLKEFEESFQLMTMDPPASEKGPESERETEHRATRPPPDLEDDEEEEDEAWMDSFEIDDEPVLSITRGRWRATDLWDFEPPAERGMPNQSFAALRHITLGTSIVLGGGAEAGLVASTGDGVEARVDGEGKLVRGSEGAMSKEERMALLAFSSRLIQGTLDEIEPGDAPSSSLSHGAPLSSGEDRDWIPEHDWTRPRRFGGWTLTSRGGERCIAVHDSDPSGGVHLLAHGFAHMGRSATLLYTCAGNGCTGATDIGPVEMRRRVDAVAQFPSMDRNDFPAEPIVWRPLAQLATSDIRRLRIDSAVLVTGARMDPINLTCEGSGNISWRCDPPLPKGIRITRVDSNSSQIVGTPRTSSEDSAKYTLTAYNRLGRVSAEVAIMVLEAPHDFSYQVQQVPATVGKALLVSVSSCQGTPPIKFRAGGPLPDGLQLNSFSGAIDGIIRSSFPKGEPQHVTIFAVNSVGACGFDLCFEPQEHKSEIADTFAKVQDELSKYTFEMPRRDDSDEELCIERPSPGAGATETKPKGRRWARRASDAIKEATSRSRSGSRSSPPEDDSVAFRAAGKEAAAGRNFIKAAGAAMRSRFSSTQSQQTASSDGGGKRKGRKADDGPPPPAPPQMV